jgi:hypothetical protein
VCSFQLPASSFELQISFWQLMRDAGNGKLAALL